MAQQYYFLCIGVNALFFLAEWYLFAAISYKQVRILSKHSIHTPTGRQIRQFSVCLKRSHNILDILLDTNLLREKMYSLDPALLVSLF